MTIQPEATFTMVYACRRVPTMTHAEYAEYYRDVHAPLSRSLPGLIAYHQMLVRQDFAWEGRVPQYDSVSTYVFPDEATAEAAWVSPEGIALNADTVKFMDWESILALPGFATRVLQPITSQE